MSNCPLYFLKIILFSVIVNLPIFSFAAVVIAAEPNIIDRQERTHIFFLPRSNDLGSGPVLAALSAVEKVKKNNPGDQIVIIIAVKNKLEAKSYVRLGLKNPVYDESLFDAVEFRRLLTSFKKIASFHYYGHSGVAAGFFLDKIEVNDYDIRYLAEDVSAIELRGHFAEDAYIRLNGCNLGQIMAPMLAKAYNVPVSAAMVGTHFEVLHKDGKFYSAETDTKSEWKSTSLDALKGSFRMRPDNSVFKGYGSGPFNRGLSFFKFFCADVDPERCQRAMAKSLIEAVGTENLSLDFSLKAFARATREWLCPAGKFPNKFQDSCMQQLAKINIDSLEMHPIENALGLFPPSLRFYSPFFGKTATCDAYSCFTFPSENDCTNSTTNMLECARRPLSPVEMRSPSDVLIREYLNYIYGFLSLKKSR